jgi:neutral ceramidase
MFRPFRARHLLIASLLASPFVPGCGCRDKDTGRDTGNAGTVAPGPLQVGAAEDWLTLPVGTPLGGYTSRCTAFGDEGDVDKRDSAYASRFNPSAGVHTRIPMKAFWFENGNENLVVLKINAIYSFDGLVEEIEKRLSAATGLNLTGRVVLATNHSHNAYANYSAQITYYLGGDKFNLENFTRTAEIAEAVAVRAWEGRQAASVGVAHWEDWDPEDEVYRDRRGENDDVQILEGIPAGRYKDPMLWMIRADALSGEPIAVLYGFGMHGTALDADNALISGDAPGATEIAFQDEFEQPVVVGFFQGGGGDASPAGSDDGLARLENVGQRAAPRLYDLWSRIETGSGDVRLEAQSTGIAETRDDIHVTRNGSVDWRYTPYDETRTPDLVVYEEDGSVAMPVDEFNVQYGAAFCGEEDPYLVGWDIGVDVFPYSSCTLVDAFVTILGNLFEVEEIPLPLVESRKAFITTARMGPFPTIQRDGSQEDADLVWSFFPGETTAYFTEAYRRRVEAELGMKSVAVVGYAQDHEGYLLLTEDWLQGGYEPAINIWGPLQGDQIMDGMLELDRALLTDEIETQGVKDGRLDYGDFALEEHALDTTPDAGTLLTESPGYLYAPLYSEDECEEGLGPELSVAGTVPRVQGIVQVAWKGGDPGVDLPSVVLERREGDAWREVTTRSGRAVSDAWHDILVAHTPDPLAPATAAQTHSWWAGWQAVGHGEPRTGLPEGDYRLHVQGQRASSPGTSWPYETVPYEVISETFTVVPGALSVQLTGDELRVSIPGPARGFRHIAEGGNQRGNNPVDGHAIDLSWVLEGGELMNASLKGGHDGSGWSLFEVFQPEDAVALVVTDRWGNRGEIAWREGGEE